MPITKATPNVISPISTTNLANSIVLRDASGNFSAGTITAALTGNASTATTATTAESCTGNSATATTLQTARTIALTGSVTGSASFDGSANISIATTTSTKVWVNFNGTTSPGTIRAQYNVSSVTKVATGTYIINFTSALPDNNYVVTMSSDGPTNVQHVNPYIQLITTTSVQIAYFNSTNSGLTADPTIACVQIIGN